MNTYFVKDPGTTKETPWHQDMPYYCVDGNDTGSFWIPLDPISKDNSLQILLGSHKFSKLVRPNKWSNISLGIKAMIILWTCQILNQWKKIY